MQQNVKRDMPLGMGIPMLRGLPHSRVVRRTCPWLGVTVFPHSGQLCLG